MARRETPEINAGSMADISFLLLIFFLVTTTMDVDTGLQRRLPQIQDEPQEEQQKLYKRNIFQIVINGYDQMLIDDNIAEIDEIRDKVIDFIDNNGDGTCTWCRGNRLPTSSDNPNKAVVSLTNDRSTSYGLYVAVQNEVVAAYNTLRDRYSRERFGKSWKELEREEIENPNDEQIIERTKEVKNAYPLNISEAEPVDYSKK
ncbi:MAG: biopolymer transporter ExbD [Flavobacteriales bacterium]|jgi:hypothetical protein|nr:biopolymer transporter ExbD [Flavobacteriales bacterium]PWM12101.1 MAG: biopolymer transporter ExbD [Flavobacteriales bacterium]